MLGLIVQAAGGCKAVAENLGVSIAHVSYLQNGKRTPGRALERLLAEKYGIPVGSWWPQKKAA